MNPNFKSITFNLEELKLLNKIIAEYHLDSSKNPREEFIRSKLLVKVYRKKIELEVRELEQVENVKRSWCLS